MDAAALIQVLEVLICRYEKAAIHAGFFGFSGVSSHLVGMAGHKVRG